MAELIVALDVPSGRQALALVDRLGGKVDVYKVGLELFTREGPALVEELQSRGLKVFLDLKLHDIPNTVAGAARAAGDLGVEFLTVHACGGSRMLAAAHAALEDSPTRLLAVTVLTSLSADELQESWGRSALRPEEEVVRLAGHAWSSGVDGFVAAPPEVGLLRSELGVDPFIVTPGIRLEGDAADDQRRVATPRSAVASGVDALVVGRSITGAPDPVRALERIREEMNEEEQAE